MINIQLVEQQIFHQALMVSFLLHAVISFCLFISNIRYEKKIPKAVEVVYYTQVQERSDSALEMKSVQSLRKAREEAQPRILTRKESELSPMLSEARKEAFKPQMMGKGHSQFENLVPKRNISIPVLQSEKITNPKYLSYNDKIRQRIKDRAYLYVHDSRFQQGEVYLTFVISSEGVLKRIKIINEKTVANDYLRNIGLRSIKESSPFPVFPPDLNYPELTFNVVISFEVND